MSDLVSTGGGHNHPAGCGCPWCTSTVHGEPDTDLVLDNPPEPVGDTRGYEQAVVDVEYDYALFTEGIGALGPDARSDRYTSVAEHFEQRARMTAQQFEPHEYPNPGETVLGELFGEVAQSARCAARARVKAEPWAGGSHVEAEQARADALVARALDTRSVTAANGVPFRARLVRKGELWGRSGTQVADEDMVFFFDARYPDHPPMIGADSESRGRDERNGQFVASYSVSTLREHPLGAGLNLNTSVPDWSIDGAAFDEITGWMDRRAPLRNNPYAEAGTEAELKRLRHIHGSVFVRDDMEQATRARNENHRAYVTRQRELRRGWASESDRERDNRE